MTAEAATRFEWERVVRRVSSMDPTTKLVALLLASYADKDGSKVRPGVARLSAVACVSPRTVKRSLVKLRDEFGLIARTTSGSSLGLKNVADVYRLVIPNDLMSRVVLLDPQEQVPQVSPASPRPGDTPDTTQVTPVTDQVTPVTKPGDTGVTPPMHDHPLDQFHLDPEVTSPESQLEAELIRYAGSHGEASRILMRQSTITPNVPHLVLLRNAVLDIRHDRERDTA